MLPLVVLLAAAATVLLGPSARAPDPSAGAKAFAVFLLWRLARGALGVACSVAAFGVGMLWATETAILRERAGQTVFCACTVGLAIGIWINIRQAGRKA